LQLGKFEVEIRGRGERRVQRKGHFMDFKNMFNVCIACTSNKKAKEMHQFFASNASGKKKYKKLKFYIIVQCQFKKYRTKSMNHKDSISNF
jgi:hypothetical protein